MTSSDPPAAPTHGVLATGAPYTLDPAEAYAVSVLQAGIDPPALEVLDVPDITDPVMTSGVGPHPDDGPQDIDFNPEVV